MDLYKIDSKGKTRILKILTEENRLIQISGLVNGKLIIHEKEISEKNIGKTNYLNGESAAKSAADSLIELKIREGYSTTKEDTEVNVMIKPMLAKNYSDYKHKIDHGSSYIQPKLDGQRCNAHLDGNGGVKLISRTQKEINTVPHIEKSLSEYRGVPIILDGELYSHDHDFQDNMSLIKKFRPGETDKYIKYNIYDTIDEQPFWIRVNRTGFYSENVVSVETHRAYNEETIEKLHAEFVSNGYEGSIIRYGVLSYEMKRTEKLLKKKDFLDTVAEIVDVEPQEADPTKGTFILKGLEGQSFGKQFKAGFRGSHEQREEILINKQNYIGQTAEVRFFEYSQDNMPRFPVVLGFRLDK